MQLQRSKQLLDGLSPKAVEIISQPGKLRDKWPLLSEDDKRTLEEALDAIAEEAEELKSKVDKLIESSPPQTSPSLPSDD
jgi:hypothetical protein